MYVKNAVIIYQLFFAVTLCYYYYSDIVKVNPMHNEKKSKKIRTCNKQADKTETLQNCQPWSICSLYFCSIGSKGPLLLTWCLEMSSWSPVHRDSQSSSVFSTCPHISSICSNAWPPLNRTVPVRIGIFYNCSKLLAGLHNWFSINFYQAFLISSGFLKVHVFGSIFSLKLSLRLKTVFNSITALKRYCNATLNMFKK